MTQLVGELPEVVRREAVVVQQDMVVWCPGAGTEGMRGGGGEEGTGKGGQSG